MDWREFTFTVTMPENAESISELNQVRAGKCKENSRNPQWENTAALQC
jgi:hypothetical protein